MKKKFLYLSIISFLYASILSADSLNSSLTNMLHEKDTSPSVNLSQLNLDGTPRVVHHTRKKRSSRTVVAIVNGHKFIKNRVDAYLKHLTHGRVKDFDLLPFRQKKRLINQMALPILALSRAKKELSKEEKLAIYSKEWMSKKARKIKISDSEVKKVYESLKEKALLNQLNSGTSGNFPSFKVLKLRIKSQMIEKKIVDNLMKNVNIKIAE